MNADTTSNKRDGAAVIGLGAAACAACCAGPILGVLAAVGISGALGFAVFGLAGLLLAAVVGIALHRRRRNRASAVRVTFVRPLSAGSPRVR